MTERTITLDKRFRTEYAYLFRALTTLGIPHAESHTESRFRVFTAETGNNHYALTAHLTEILLTPFRFRYFVDNAITPTKLTDYLVLFTAMNVDGTREYVQMLDVLDPLTEIHIDALYNFGLGEFKTRWAKRANLVSDFVATAPTQDETLEFCSCLIGASKARTERKVRYLLTDDENVHVIQRHAYYCEDVKRFPKGTEDAQKLIGKLRPA